jgi:hypothetical protein
MSAARWCKRRAERKGGEFVELPAEQGRQLVGASTRRA